MNSLKVALVGLVAWNFAAVANCGEDFGGLVEKNYERPIQSATLQLVSGDAQHPTPFRLTLNKRDDSVTPTSFTLSEDTGIRCVMAPCPSMNAVQFKIQSVENVSYGVVRYVAYEVMRPLPHVRLAARRLVVTDFMHDPSDLEPFGWTVELRSLMGTATYGGNPAEH